MMNFPGELCHWQTTLVIVVLFWVSKFQAITAYLHQPTINLYFACTGYWEWLRATRHLQFHNMYGHLMPSPINLNQSVKGKGNGPKCLTDGLCHDVTKEYFDLGDKANSSRVLVNTLLAWPHFWGDWSCLRTVNPNEVLANTIMSRQHHLKEWTCVLRTQLVCNSSSSNSFLPLKLCNWDSAFTFICFI